MKIEKANPKMGFGGPNKALAKIWDLKAKLVSNLGGELKNEWEKEKRRGRGRRRREEEEEEIKQKGMETTLGMDFVWITWNFKALYG